MASNFDTSDSDAYTKPFNLTPNYHRDIYPFISPESPQNSQKGNIIIVIGGGDGIGAAAAKVWARAGAEGIVLVARRKETLDVVADDIRKQNKSVKVLVASADVTNGSEVQGVFSQVKETFGKPADVLLQVAGLSAENEMIGDTDPDEWWKSFNINLKGAYSTTHHFIQSQKDPKDPVGTIIIVSGNRAGLTESGQSAYNISKLAQQRLIEHLDLEYPRLRSFTASPGIVLTRQITPAFAKYATDNPELLGCMSLYLMQSRADYLRGSYVNVNWDLEDMEAYKEEIVNKKLLKTSWLPIMPIGGGTGLGGTLA